MDKLFTHSKKRFSDGEISNRDAKNISGELGFNRAGARREFEKALHGPVTREKIRKKLQDMVAGGKISDEKAKSVIRQLGVTRKDLCDFKDISEYRAIHKNETLKKGDKSTNAGQPIDSSLKKKEDNSAKKATSIYDILTPKF